MTVELSYKGRSRRWGGGPEGSLNRPMLLSDRKGGALPTLPTAYVFSYHLLKAKDS